MTVCDIFDKDADNTGLVVGLGYFDTVHRGHEYLINKVVELSAKLGATPAVFTFSNDPFRSLGKSTKSVFDFDERKLRLSCLGVKKVIGAYFDENFSSLSGEEFLSVLTENHNVVHVVAGSDFRCGKNANCGTDEIIDILSKKGVGFDCVELVKAGGVKIASRDIRVMLEEGDVEKVNTLLSMPYAVTGEVLEGRRDGRRIGFPTVNMEKNDLCVIPKDGVYATVAIVRGKRYKGVTNVGTHPTFNDLERNIETHIIGFDGEIYGETVRIEFLKRLRGVMKFASVDALRAQIASDREKVIREVEI